MSSTTFVNQITPIEASWLNDVNTSVYKNFFDVALYGASRLNTASENKTALQSAISAANSSGGGVVIVPSGINYGYVRTDVSTHPDFTGCTTSIVVIDYGIGSSYTSPAKDGAQIRHFFYTPNPGNDDGNIQYHRAPYHPAFLFSNDADLAAAGDPSRTADDNRRISILFGNDGVDGWRIGQGDRSGASLTTEEMSNLVIESYAQTGDTLPNYAPLIIERKTGNWAFGVGNTTPTASYYFKSVTAGYESMIVESLDVNSYFTLRNSNGSGDDISLLNKSGQIALNISSQGDALTINKADRHVGIGAAGDYQLDVAESRASNFVSKIQNQSATNGQILSLQSNSATGTGWDGLLIEATASSSPNALFRLRGDGNGLCDGAWSGGGADRAEMFEWADGNPDGIDGDKKEVGSNRAGYSVSLVGGKIKICEVGEIPIGVVSVTYDSLGNASPLNWQGKFLKDDFGNPSMEECVIVEWEEKVLVAPEKPAIPSTIRTYIRNGIPYEFTDPGMPAQEARYETKKHSYYSDELPSGIQVPDNATRTIVKRRKINPGFDKETFYVPRTGRKEWDAVGVLGICRMRKNQISAPTWIKLRDISAEVEEWLIK